MQATVRLDGTHLDLQEVRAVANGARVEIGPTARAQLTRAQAALDRATSGGRAIYGVTTGFGPFGRDRISEAEIDELQVNLLRSHSVGYGPALPVAVVRAMLVLRAHSIARGFSGVGPALVEAIVGLLNAGVTPVVPERGSVGASGDLAPLAHLGLGLLGEGDADLEGQRMPMTEALQRTGLRPHPFRCKEGLALINGTQYMTARGVLATAESDLVLRVAQVAAALSIEALLGSVHAFLPRVHALRPHPGQQAVAANLTTLLEGSDIVSSHSECDRVQDPYSLRCTPVVLGASLDALRHTESVLAIETDSVTDNPLVFPEDSSVVSAGNFHGQPLALVLDHLAVALCEVASLAERRLFLLLYSDVDKLPRCLAGRPGVESGLMMVQYLAAALVSENRTLCHPATLDNVVTGGGMEDHNSMGSIAAARLPQLLRNTRGVLAAELLAATEALEYHAPLEGARATRAAHDVVRQHVRKLHGDRALAPDVEALARPAVLESIVQAVETALGSKLVTPGPYS